MPRLLVGEKGLKSIEKGAATIVWGLLTDEVKGGEYLDDCAVVPTLHQLAEDVDL